MSNEEMLSPPFSKCPKCNANTYGILAIVPWIPEISKQSFVAQGCSSCRYHEFKYLPFIKKRVIYLDQNVVSNLMFVANPNNAKHQKVTADPYYPKLYEKLILLIKYNLVICPYSNIHIEESIPTKEFSNLQTFQKTLSNRINFKHNNAIEEVQVLKCFKNFLEERPDLQPVLEESDCFDIDPNCWYMKSKATDDLLMNFPVTEEDAEEVRSIHEKSHNALANNTYTRWKKGDKKFDDLVWEEAQSFGREKIESLMAYSENRRRLREGETQEEMLKPPAVDLLMALFRCARQHDFPEEKIVPLINGFLNAKSILDVPSVRISSEYFASVARKFKSAIKNPNEGMINDSIALANFLPYCDAFFTDNENYFLFEAEPLKSEKKRYNVEIFSYKTIEKFIDYLEEIWQKADESHLATVRAIYPPEWLESMSLNFS